MNTVIALIGNPNSGKTTLFNALTGDNQYVGNWPGVTVAKKTGKLKNTDDVEIVDLPGIYSLSPYTLEEVVSRDFLLKEKPDAIINIVDSSNLERNLYLTMQILELKIPMVVVLNMMDLVKAKHDHIDVKGLSEQLGCVVTTIEAINGTGINEMTELAVAVAKNKNPIKKVQKFDDDIERAILKIEGFLPSDFDSNLKRWTAIKYFENDEKVIENSKLEEVELDQIDDIRKKIEDRLDNDSENIITEGRYKIIENILKETFTKGNLNVGLTVSDKIDKFVTNKFFAIPIFFFLMYAMYYVSIDTLGDYSIELISDIFASIGEVVAATLASMGVSEVLIGAIVDGAISGVGAVMTFVPQIMLLFLFISFLEDCGYMARVAFIMDRVFRKFGLSGRSFIPMIVGTGCSVPGIMATRTIENENDRRMTIMLTPFIPCGAKLPIIALMAAALFPEHSWVAPSMYLWGIAMVIVSGTILKKINVFGGEPAPFIMELPPYHIPAAKTVFGHMWERGSSFIKKAGTIIFAGCIVIWLFQNLDMSLALTSNPENSILAHFGRIIAPLFAPLGFGTWQAAFATVTGLLAKEVVVASFGILYGVAGAEATDPTLLEQIRLLFTPASAYAFMLFTIFAPPCLAAIGAIRSEMESTKWTAFALSYQLVVGYLMAFLAYNVGTWIL